MLQLTTRMRTMNTTINVMVVHIQAKGWTLEIVYCILKVDIVLTVFF